MSVVLDPGSHFQIEVKRLGVQGIQGPPGLPGDGQTLVAGESIEIDNTDPANPVISSTAVKPSRAISAGTGLAGGGDLATDRSLALSADTLVSLGKADSAIQPSAIGDSVQAHSNRLQSLTDATGVEGQVPNLKLDGTFELADAGSGDMRKNVFDPNGKEADAFDQDNMADGTTNKNYTATEKARVADAVTNSDTSTAAMDFVLDEDDLTSNSATKLPTQQSVKANIDARAPKGRFNTVAAMLADTDFGYASARFIVVADDRIETDGYLYDVAASGASDHDVTTAGGVKLYVRPVGGSLDPMALGAAGDGVIDDIAHINAAVNKMSSLGGGRVIVSKPHATTDVINLKSNVRLEGRAGGKILKTSTGVSSYAVAATGATSGAGTALTLDAPAHAKTVYATSTGFAAGDRVLIRSNKYVDAVNSNGRYQEFVEIQSVAVGSITFTTNLLDDFAVSDGAEVIKVNAVENVGVVNLEIDCPQNARPTYNGGHINFDLVWNGLVSRNKLRYPDSGMGLRTYRSAHLLIKGNVVTDGQNAVAGGSYGEALLIDEATHHVLITGNRFVNINQNAIQNNASFITFSHNLIDGATDSGINTHASRSRHILIHGNIITNANTGIAVSFSGGTGIDSDIVVSGNSVSLCNTNGIAVSGSSSTANDATRVNVFGNVIGKVGMETASCACISASNVSNVNIGHNMCDAGDYGGSQKPSAAIKISACSMVAVTQNFALNTSGGYGIQAFNSSDYEISGNVINNVSSHNVITSGSTNGRVFNNKADDTTVSIEAGVRQFGNSWQGLPQSGTDSISLAASAFASKTVTFPIAFPATPKVVVVGDDGGGIPCSIQASSASTTGFTLSVRAASSQTLTKNVMWIALP